MMTRGRYMALFELAPPHTHSRAANTVYLLCFVCGASLAYLADVAEGFARAHGEGQLVIDLTAPH